ncbi:MAG: S-layer homology domain-containing protein [Candidatus Gracilibacteria bacterium]
MKKIMSMIAVSIISLQIGATSVFAMPIVQVPLSDIADTQYQAAIEYLYGKGVIKGYDDGTFKPNKTISRGELLKILVGGAGYIKPDATIYHDCFPDVKSDWYAPYICFAKEKGWVNGYDDNMFRPEKAISKVEAIKMLMGSEFPPALNAASQTSKYLDVDFKKWYGQYMFPAEAMKILDFGGMYYYPESFITRGEISNNMYRAMLILDQKVGSFDQVDFNKVGVSVLPSAPTVTVASQTYSDITLAVKLPAYTGDSALDSVFSSFTNPNDGMGQSGSMNIALNNIVGTWTTTFHVNPKPDAVGTSVYEFTFWVNNKNGNVSEKTTIKVSGLSANPERPTINVTSITKNNVTFNIVPAAYTGNSALATYNYQSPGEGGSYTKTYFENNMNNKLSVGALTPNTEYTMTFWVVNALGKASSKATVTIKTAAN